MVQEGMLNIAKFRVLPESQLSEQDFDDYPVWSEYYDWEEIEDLERWGLNREKVLHLFEKNSPGNEHCVYTLLEYNPFPDRMRVFIRAAITTKNGLELKGFIMNEDAYCLALFYQDEEFIFSQNPLLELENQRTAEQLQSVIGTSTSLFPVRYKTEFKSAQGSLIAGEFMYGLKKV
ncbi:hypothetical protein ON05_027335 [Acaryochloris sp. CCMEE 5410]|nr:hypothetical protein ON05_027335 [Acaryochloris sp. CCMEE 5410]